MAVQQIPFTRGGKQYTEHIGKDANGQSVHYIEEIAPDAATGQPALWRPIETTIKRKGLGATASILTVFERVLVASNGELLTDTGKMERWFTNEQDILFFVAAFGMPIMMSEANLFVRRGLGFNNLPLWDAPTGTVKTYTPEQEAEEPTNDYWS